MAHCTILSVSLCFVWMYRVLTLIVKHSVPRLPSCQVFCNLTCSAGSCGGHQGGMDYFSLYCGYRLGEDLTGVLPPGPHDQASTETPGPEASPSVTMGQLLQEVASLNSIAVILAGLLCIIVVFLLLILTYIYFKRQDKRLFKSNKKTLQALNSKLLNSDEKSYGSNNTAYDDTNDEDEVFSKETTDSTKEGQSTFFSTNGAIANTSANDDEVFHKGNPEVKKEGKSKFYNVQSGPLPEDPRGSKSQFYRQPAMDLKTPSVESEGGFQDIFAGGQLQPIESDKGEDDNKTEDSQR